MVTKLVLAESGYTDVERHTKDVDANWVGTPPSMSSLVATLNSAFAGDGRFEAVPFRDYEEKKSAGITIKRKGTDEELFDMDISIKPVIGSRVYYHGETSIRGVLANEILADKISVLSKKNIFRRAKDVVDVYALSHCVRVDTSEIFEIWRSNPGREIGAFIEFLTRRADVEHAYLKLEGITGKPEFAVVYDYLEKFIQPFAGRDEARMVWYSDTQSWEDHRIITELER